MQISKSDYMLYLRHPAWLWLKKNDKEKLPAVDAGLQTIFDAGYVFHAYAEQQFSGGVTLGFNDYDEYRSLPQRTTVEKVWQNFTIQLKCRTIYINPIKRIIY